MITLLTTYFPNFTTYFSNRSKTLYKSYWLLLPLICAVGYIAYAANIEQTIFNKRFGQPVEFFDQTTNKIWRMDDVGDDYIYYMKKERPYPQPVATKHNVKGKTVLIHDQGFGYGDVFMILPIARLLKKYGAKKIIFEVPRKGYVPITECCPDVDEAYHRGVLSKSFDVHTRAFGFLFNDKLLPQFEPCITTPKHLNDKWKKRLATDKNLKVGLCWQAGGTWDTKAFGASRSMEMEEINKLIDVPNVTFYSVQRLRDGSAVPKKNNLVIFDDLDKNTPPFIDTAALIQNLDLVITVDTSIAHLAGCLGVPTWIMLIKRGSWRFFETGTKTTPWYPSATLFWQKQLGKWDHVINEVKTALKKRVAK